MPMEKTFDAASAEPRIYAAWETAGAFRAGANASKPETFTIMIPPPNVTGSLHVGHAFNNTLQDILTRWKRMQGYDVLWQPGTDHAGIATQLVVERKLAEKGNDSRAEMGREKFLKKVWEWKAESGGNIRNQLKRLGASCDWDREAFTMDPNFHDAVIKVFVDMYDKGLIYRGKRLVNWDPHFETAISDLEVENVETPGHMWHFKYPLAGGATYTYVEKDQDGDVLFTEERDYIAIATTRPETMLGDGAIAVHPSDERYAAIVGQLCEIPVGPKEHRRLIPIITDDYPDPTFGSGAVKITGAHDFNDYAVAQRNKIPMYSLLDTKGAMRADGRPYGEEAASAQRIAQGAEDFDEAKIAAMNLVPDAYRGLDRFDARKAVVADITAEGLAVMVPVTDPRLGKPIKAPLAPEEGGEARDDTLVPLVEPKPIMQPFGDRSKVVIEPMLTDQWFVDTAKIVGPALDAVRNGDVRIMPESGEKVFYHWLENIEPWCISRRLWWGHQLPVWYGPAIADDGEPDFGNPKHFCGASFAAVKNLAEAYYSGKFQIEELDFEKAKAWQAKFFESYNRKAQSAGKALVSDDDIKASKLFELEKIAGQNTILRLGRDPDVLDTWFSSGLWPIGTLGWPNWDDSTQKYFPTSVLITGQDILFFWVARMMMMQQAVVGENPFHTVYLHQLVRDEKGEKMSKTRGNVIDPLDIVDEYGADALRFTMAQMAALGGVLKLSEDRIKGYRNFGTKLWNAARFAEMNGATHSDGAIPTPTATVNKWIIGETAKVRAEVDTALETYRFNDAANALYAFVWGKVCDWYVEFSKPLLLDGTDTEKHETQRTMAWVIDQCLILLHPIMPFITEELWATLGDHPKPLIHTDWPTYGDELVDVAAMAEMTWTISLIDGIRSARAQMNVPAGLKIPVLMLDADDSARTTLASNEALVMRLARLVSISPAQTPPKGSVTIPTAGATFALPLADIIDVAAEKARLGKALDKLGKEIGGLNGRLNNPKFAASAPEDIVAEARANLALRADEAAQLTAALERLAEID